MGSKIRILNAGYTNLTAQELLDCLMEDVGKRQKSSVIFLNVDVVMKLEKDKELADITERAEYVLADGMPLVWVSKLFHRPLKEKVSGSDFVPKLCSRAAKEGYSIFLAGGKEGVARQAAQKLKEAEPELKIAGVYCPPFGFEKDPTELEKFNRAVAESGADIVIVCLGCPKQEKYIAKNRDSYGAAVSVCAGATIDFLAGNVKRCPAWMSRCGLEWFYRFCQEPGRLFRRYFVDDVKILGLIWRYRKQKQGGD